MRQCGSNNVPLLLCGKSPALLGKSGIMCMKTYHSATPLSQKNLVSVLETFFFQEQGKRASLPGCDLSDIRQHCRPVPSRAENQKSPCLPWAQCNSQSSQSMSWTEPLEHASQWFLLKEGEEWEKKEQKSQGRWFWLYLRISCHVE